MLATLYPDKAYFFWIFLGALAVNSVYPFVLLNATSRWWRRDAVAWRGPADTRDSHAHGAARVMRPPRFVKSEIEQTENQFSHTAAG